MTCIVGMVHDKGVTMGCDSQVTSGWTHSTLSKDSPKVFRKGDMLIGTTGTLRMLQLAHYALVIPDHPPEMDCIAYLATLFADAVRECFKNAGHAMKDKEQESNDGNLLIAYRGRLFSLGSYYSVSESAIGYDSVGSGEQVALGAMHMSAHMGEMITTDKRILWALEAASEFSSDVRGPYVIETLGNK